jgi:hypothetical protein
MLGVILQFDTTNRQNPPPLTPAEKFHLRKERIRSGGIRSRGTAGCHQSINKRIPEYGQEAGVYGKRYGAVFADEVSTGFWANYLYAVLLKEDSRYSRLGEGHDQTPHSLRAFRGGYLPYRQEWAQLCLGKYPWSLCCRQHFQSLIIHLASADSN